MNFNSVKLICLLLLVFCYVNFTSSKTHFANKLEIKNMKELSHIQETKKPSKKNKKLNSLTGNDKTKNKNKSLNSIIDFNPHNFEECKAKYNKEDLTVFMKLQRDYLSCKIGTLIKNEKTYHEMITYLEERSIYLLKEKDEILHFKDNPKTLEITFTHIHEFIESSDIDEKEKQSRHEFINSYLVFKMLLGDEASYVMFSHLPSNKEKYKYFENDENILAEIYFITGDISSRHVAYFFAYKFLSLFPVDKSYCKNRTPVINEFNDYQVSFLERKRNKVRRWQNIKLFKTGYRSDHVSESVTKLIEANKYTECAKLPELPNSYKPDNVANLRDIEFSIPLKDCPIQIIGPITKQVNLKEMKTAKIENEYGTISFKYHSPENKRPIFNCHSWALGLNDFYWGYFDVYGVRNEIRSLYNYIKSLKQLKRTYKVKESLNLYDHMNNYNLIERVEKNGFLYKFIMSSEDDTEYLLKRIVLRTKYNFEQFSEKCKDLEGSIMMFIHEGILVHSTKYITAPLKIWTSKIGQSYLITHEFGDMDKSDYGKAILIMCPSEMDIEPIIEDVMFS